MEWKINKLELKSKINMCTYEYDIIVWNHMQVQNLPYRSVICKFEASTSLKEGDILYSWGNKFI